MQANIKQYPVVSPPDHPAQAVLAVNVTERAGLRSRRERMSSTLISSPVSNSACAGRGFLVASGSASAVLSELGTEYRVLSAPSSSSSEEQLPAIGCCSMASKIVGLCSTARRKRNHV